MYAFVYNNTNRWIDILGREAYSADEWNRAVEENGGSLDGIHDILARRRQEERAAREAATPPEKEEETEAPPGSPSGKGSSAPVSKGDCDCVDFTIYEGTLAFDPLKPFGALKGKPRQLPSHGGKLPTKDKMYLVARVKDVARCSPCAGKVMRYDYWIDPINPVQDISGASYPFNMNQRRGSGNVIGGVNPDIEYAQLPNMNAQTWPASIQDPNDFTKRRVVSYNLKISVNGTECKSIHECPVKAI